MILIDDKILYAHRTYMVNGYRECMAVLRILPRWATIQPPSELEELNEALVADYQEALVIYDLPRERAYVLLEQPNHSVRLEADLPTTFCYGGGENGGENLAAAG